MAGGEFDVINARFTYKNVPLYKLERYSFPDRAAAYEAFGRVPGASGVVILQTASRVEVYMAVNKERDAPDARSEAGRGLAIKQIEATWTSLTDLGQYDLDHFDQALEVYRNGEAYAHLLRLATGLESVVVGKGEILDEMRSSAAHADEAGASGAVLSKLFGTAIRVGARIRESTGIGDSVLTVGDIAVKMAEDGAGMGGKKRVLLLGTGQAAAQVAKAMNGRGYAFDVASRDLERAAGFSKILGGTPVEFADALAGFDRYDVVLVATTADYHVLTAARVAPVMDGKKTGTMILDVSEPRAVNEDVSSVPGIKLMFRDQVAEQEEENLRARVEKVPEVEKQIAKEAPVVEAMMERLEPDPVVAGVAAGVDELRREELQKAISELGETDEARIRVLERLTKAVVDRIVSAPGGEKAG